MLGRFVYEVKFTSVIENLVSLDYTDQYLRLKHGKNRPTISLDVLKDINKYILK